MEVMTVVEGKVPESKRKEFESTYASARDQPKPPGWMMSMLLRDVNEEGLYRISTRWETREALEKMRVGTKVPVALALFRNVGVEPNLRVFEIPITIQNYLHSAGPREM